MIAINQNRAAFLYWHMNITSIQWGLWNYQVELILNERLKKSIHTSNVTGFYSISSKPPVAVASSEETKRCSRCLRKLPFALYCTAQWEKKYLNIDLRDKIYSRALSENHIDVIKSIECFGEEPFSWRRCKACSVPWPIRSKRTKKQ